MFEKIRSTTFQAEAKSTYTCPKICFFMFKEQYEYQYNWNQEKEREKSGDDRS